jgi:hypothetical protein
MRNLVKVHGFFQETPYGKWLPVAPLCYIHYNQNQHPRKLLDKGINLKLFQLFRKIIEQYLVGQKEFL